MLSRRACLSALAAAAHTAPIPKMQAVPLPGFQVSLQRSGREVTRYHCNPELRRPFLFPVIGPSGRMLTRMGHPHDPEGHSHHNSIWISHHDVNGVTFWGDKGPGQIVHQRIEKLIDGMNHAAVIAHAHWMNNDTNRILMKERRTITVHDLPDNELLIALDLELQGPATFGKTPFGLLGVRLAKTISVNDGGGVLRNSAGKEDEPNILWQRARWVDYSGPITDQATEGITLFDHPSNTSHPSYFHVRRDGWMGACASYDAPRKFDTLKLRYGLYVHAGTPPREALEKRYLEFAR